MDEPNRTRPGVTNPDITELVQRHRAFWRRERVDRPLLTLKPRAPLAPLRVPLADGTWLREPRFLTPDTMPSRALLDLGIPGHSAGRLVLGGTFAVRAPWVRIPWMEAILGCPIWADMGSGSLWSQPLLRDPHDYAQVTLRPDNPWLAKLLELTRLLAERQDGTYLTTLTLMRGPIDLARAVLGDESMCLSIHDAPEAMRSLLDVATDAFIEVTRRQLEIIPRFHGGYCSQFGIWAPGTVVRTQCDISALLSPRTYAELVVPFEEKACRPFEYSIIHLHSGYLHTVDALLAVEHPQAIQISLDTGSTRVTVADVVAIAQRILPRKPLLIEGLMTAEELDYVLATLPPEGLYIGAELDRVELERARHTLAHDPAV